MNKRRAVYWLSAFLASTPVLAEVTYDSAANAVKVVGYYESNPATIWTLLEAEAKNDWKKITYDTKNKTLTIDADLWIGDDRAWGSFLQLGDKQFPNPTIVLKGNLWVKPPKDSAKRIDGRYSVMNGLTLGVKSDASISATLLFDCPTNYARAFCVGERRKGQNPIVRGALRVYNSRVSALTADGKHNWSDASEKLGTFGWYASEVDLERSTFSFFQRLYGVQTGTTQDGEIAANPFAVVRDCVFENGGTGFQNGYQYLDRCVFRNMACPIAEGGCLMAKAVQCVFENNAANFSLGAGMATSVTFLDCRVGPPKLPIAILKNRTGAKELAARKIPVYPFFRIQDVLRVKVVDSAGKPVADAGVDVACPAAPDAVARGVAMTNKDGATPGDLDAALIVTTGEYVATDNPIKPTRRTFAYEIAVVSGDTRERFVYDTGKGVEKELTITLAAASKPRETTR